LENSNAKSKSTQWSGKTLQKKTASGYKHKHQHKSHILTKMTTKRKRQLRGTSILNAADKPRVDRMLRNV